MMGAMTVRSDVPMQTERLAAHSSGKENSDNARPVVYALHEVGSAFLCFDEK
jgi:hypothetical protein